MRIGKEYIRKEEPLIHEEGDLLKKYALEALIKKYKSNGTLFGNDLDNRDKEKTIENIESLLRDAKKIVLKDRSKVGKMFDFFKENNDGSNIGEFEEKIASMDISTLVEIMHRIRKANVNCDRHHDPYYLEKDLPDCSGEQIKLMETNLKEYVDKSRENIQHEI